MARQRRADGAVAEIAARLSAIEARALLHLAGLTERDLGKAEAWLEIANGGRGLLRYWRFDELHPGEPPAIHPSAYAFGQVTHAQMFALYALHQARETLVILARGDNDPRALIHALEAAEFLRFAEVAAVCRTASQEVAGWRGINSVEVAVREEEMTKKRDAAAAAAKRKHDKHATKAARNRAAALSHWSTKEWASFKHAAVRIAPRLKVPERTVQNWLSAAVKSGEIADKRARKVE